ncbi:MAG TPA: hypothetical protein VFC51_19675 [Chloroflexota bacterium]|nr:hypothetical protein [Chloroflexota bacterium]
MTDTADDQGLALAGFGRGSPAIRSLNMRFASMKGCDHVTTIVRGSGPSMLGTASANCGTLLRSPSTIVSPASVSSSMAPRPRSEPTDRRVRACARIAGSLRIAAVIRFAAAGAVAASLDPPGAASRGAAQATNSTSDPAQKTPL